MTVNVEIWTVCEREGSTCRWLINQMWKCDSPPPFLHHDSYVRIQEFAFKTTKSTLGSPLIRQRIFSPPPLLSLQINLLEIVKDKPLLTLSLSPRSQIFVVRGERYVPNWEIFLTGHKMWCNFWNSPGFVGTSRSVSAKEILFFLSLSLCYSASSCLLVMGSS